MIRGNGSHFFSDHNANLFDSINDWPINGEQKIRKYSYDPNFHFGIMPGVMWRSVVESMPVFHQANLIIQRLNRVFHSS